MCQFPMYWSADPQRLAHPIGTGSAVSFHKVEFDRSQNEYVVKNAREAIDWLNES